MKDLGALHYCLGIEFKQKNKSVTMSQMKYLQSILTTYGMQEAKPLATSLDKNSKSSKDMGPTTEEEIAEMKDIPYQSLIGSLMYLAVSTRPDISYAISVLSQFNMNPGKAHWSAAKRVLRYLKGTVNYGLVYTKMEVPLIGFVDADWGGNVDDRVSYTGFVFKLANAAITWEARKQKSIALSSTEAEYMALTEAAKETVYLRNLLEEMCYLKHQSEPTTVYCDNQGAQKLMRNPMYHSRTKHIDIRHKRLSLRERRFPKRKVRREIRIHRDDDRKCTYQGSIQTEPPKMCQGIWSKRY
ncbi:gag-pol polyprotein [Lasius niger]|uniref:Gag-pol polyprotein n=1 Tax=Lasius niger TaxID=67767 RepID=A0A0J7N854_LASNI|nr:gag-pol polyprotein [Lasius niger]